MENIESPKWYHYQRTEGTQLAGPWILIWVVSTILLQIVDLPIPVRAPIALLPLPAFGWFLWRYLQHIRTLDEMRHRIELEALAIAFPLTVALLMTLGQLQMARRGAPGFEVTNWFWVYLIAFYLLGRKIAERRYA